MVIVEPHGFPKADGGRAHAIGNDFLKMLFAVVDELPAVAVSFPFRINIDRIDGDRPVNNPATNFADGLAILGKIDPIIL